MIQNIIRAPLTLLLKYQVTKAGLSVTPVMTHLSVTPPPWFTWSSLVSAPPPVTWTRGVTTLSSRLLASLVRAATWHSYRPASPSPTSLMARLQMTEVGVMVRTAWNLLTRGESRFVVEIETICGDLDGMM